MKRKTWLPNGLWPYTPDPGLSGLIEVGQAPVDCPVFCVGNSRYELKRCRRILAAIGGRLLSIDTEGVGLYSLLKDGKVTSAAIGEALAQTGPLPEPTRRIGFLPYPVWLSLSGKQDLLIAGWQIKAGPANIKDIPAFIASNYSLAASMKTVLYPFAERLKITYAQAALVLAFALIPLALGGLQSLVIGIVLTALSALGVAYFQPIIHRLKGRLWIYTAYLGLFSLLCAVLTAVVLPIGTAGGFAVGVGVLLLSSWLALVLARFTS